MSLAGITLAAECQCCICQWPWGDVRYARRCSECKRIGLDHIEADPCLYPRFFPIPSPIERASKNKEEL